MKGHDLPARGQALRGVVSACLAAALLWSGMTLPAAEPEKTDSQQEESKKPLKKQAALFLPVTPVAKTALHEFQSVPSAPAPAGGESLEGEWFMEWRYSVNRTNLKGNKERSFLNEGVNHLAEFTLLRKRTLWQFRQVEAMGLFRYTDDPRVDPEVNSLQRGYLRLSGPTFEANFGDFLTSYSRFSFNQNTKGINAWKRLPVRGGLRLVGTAGVFTDRWGSIFRGFEEFADPRSPVDPRFPAKPYTRLVLGARAEQHLDENSFLAFNYAQGSDIIRSLPREAQVRPFNNQVVGFDASLRLGRDFTVTGELAYSFTQFDARLQRDKRSDYAGRLQVSHRWKRVSWRVAYARFMPNFFSVNARQVQDLQDASVRGTVDLAKNVALSASWRHTNDNLPGDPVVVFDPSTVAPVALTNAGRTQTGTITDPVTGGTITVVQRFPFIVDANGRKLTTTVRTPEVRLQFRRLPPHGRLNLTAGYRERQFETSNDGSFSIDTTTGEATPLFRERVTKIPFLDLEWTLSSTLLGLSYEYRHNRDRAQSLNSTFTNRLVASYRGSYFWGAWVVTPSFRFETEAESKQVEPSSLDLLANPLVLAVTGNDQTRSIQGSVTVDFPRYVSLEAFYRELNAELLTPFDSGGLRLFGNGGYQRPYFRTALTYRIRNSEDRYVVASFERSVNTFLAADAAAPDLRSFRENTVQLGFVIRWRR